MLSIGKLAAGQEAYYLDGIARGAEDYYRENGEVPGRWVGAGARRLGLHGEVGDDALTELLSGVDPYVRYGARTAGPTRHWLRPDVLGAEVRLGVVGRR